MDAARSTVARMAPQLYVRSCCFTSCSLHYISRALEGTSSPIFLSVACPRDEFEDANSFSSEGPSFNKKYSLADKLRLIGSSISDANLQLFILHGLSIEYDPCLHKHSLAVAGIPSSPAFSLNLATATSATSPLPQANLVSQFILGPTPSTDNDLMHQFSAFLASRSGWCGKQHDKINSFVNIGRLLC
jgi:hypothetical protein